MRQGVVLPETPRDRRNLEALEADLRHSPLRGRELPLRLRNFRPDAGSYLASLGGPLPYMARLRPGQRTELPPPATRRDVGARTVPVASSVRRQRTAART